MRDCWRYEPRTRIKFTTILTELSNHCTEEQRAQLLSSIKQPSQKKLPKEEAQK